MSDISGRVRFPLLTCTSTQDWPQFSRIRRLLSHSPLTVTPRQLFFFFFIVCSKLCVICPRSCFSPFFFHSLTAFFFDAVWKEAPSAFVCQVLKQNVLFQYDFFFLTHMWVHVWCQLMPAPTRCRQTQQPTSRDGGTWRQAGRRRKERNR